MKVWLALAGLVCSVGGQYTGRSYDDGTQGQYRVVEQAQSSGSDNDHVSSHISPLVALPTSYPRVVSPSHAIAHSLVVSAGGVQTLPTHVQTEQYDSNPHYSYSYSVHNPHNGDVKGHTETRQGNVVSGSYSLMEADGSIRIVDYTADPIHGFNAVVRNTPTHNQVVHPSIPQHVNTYHQPLYHYQQTASNPSSINVHNQQLSYAPSAQVVSPSNEVSYVISYQTPSHSSGNHQYAVEHNNNAFTLNRIAYPSNNLQRTNQHQSSPQSNQNQQGSYYTFRMTQNQQSNSQQSVQNQSNNSQQQISHEPHIIYNNQPQNINRLSMSNSQSTNNYQGHPSISNQGYNNENQRSSGYMNTNPTGSAYPTATPAYHY